MNPLAPGLGMPFDEAHSIESAGMGFATAGLICGIAGALSFGVFFGPLAVIFGLIGVVRSIDMLAELVQSLCRLLYEFRA